MGIRARLERASRCPCGRRRDHARERWACSAAGSACADPARERGEQCHDALVARICGHSKRERAERQLDRGSREDLHRDEGRHDTRGGGGLGRRCGLRGELRSPVRESMLGDADGAGIGREALARGIESSEDRASLLRGPLPPAGGPGSRCACCQERPPSLGRNGQLAGPRPAITEGLPLKRRTPPRLLRERRRGARLALVEPREQPEKRHLGARREPRKRLEVAAPGRMSPAGPAAAPPSGPCTATGGRRRGPATAWRPTPR